MGLLTNACSREIVDDISGVFVTDCGTSNLHPVDDVNRFDVAAKVGLTRVQLTGVRSSKLVNHDDVRVATSGVIVAGYVPSLPQPY